MFFLGGGVGVGVEVQGLQSTQNKWEKKLVSSNLLISFLMPFLEPTFIHAKLQVIPNRQL